jgi:transposase
MARPFKDIDDRILVKLFMEGYSSRELARKYNVTHQTILNRVKKYVDIDFDPNRSVKKVIR